MLTITLVRHLLAGLFTRTKVVSAKPGTVRPALNLKSLQGESLNNIALNLPYGMTAIPAAGADVVVLRFNEDHKIALFADDPTLRIKDAKGGELGYRDARGTQIVWRGDHLEITAETVPIVVTAKGGQPITLKADKVIIDSPNVRLGGDGGKKIALDGDPVVGGHVQSSATKAWAQ